MLEHDVGIATLAKLVPHRLAEGSGTSGPLALTLAVLPVWRHTPMIKVSAIHIADRTELLAILAAFVAGDDGDGPGTMRGC